MLPFRIILIAADFSDGSKDAFRLACSLADDTARLVVLHVVEPSPRADQPRVLGEFGLSVPLGHEERLHHESLQARLREEYVPHVPVAATYHTGVGDAAEEILRMADEVVADLIVLGTHGRTGLRRLLAGSVAEAVLRRSRRPVLALRSADLPRGGNEIGAILHPTDFSTGSEPALRVARSIARGRGLQLIVLGVVPPPIAIEGTVVSNDPQAARDSLEAIRAGYDGPDLKVPLEIRLCQGDAAVEILRVADEIGCGLIVMGTHGRTGLGRFLVGSVAEAVLREAACPVLVVKAPPPERAAARVLPVEKSVTIY